LNDVLKIREDEDTDGDEEEFDKDVRECKAWLVVVVDRCVP
jgi:hypothetical protein